ncbi:MAG: hypothetical protein IT305_12220 [Chloroflexi bacterium]|nr:hypothetical protein [Chloroflexota bacterium]
MADQRPQDLEAPWRRHPAFAAVLATVFVLAVGVGALRWHLAGALSDSASGHVAAGDFVFFGMLVGLVLLAAGLVIARTRRARSAEQPE